MGGGGVSPRRRDAKKINRREKVKNKAQQNAGRPQEKTFVTKRNVGGGRITKEGVEGIRLLQKKRGNA